MRDDRERLLDIKEALDNIERYAVFGRERFMSDELVRTWIIHDLEIIGEAARGLSAAFCEGHPGALARDSTHAQRLGTPVLRHTAGAGLGSRRAGPSSPTGTGSGYAR